MKKVDFKIGGFLLLFFALYFITTSFKKKDDGLKSFFNLASPEISSHKKSNTKLFKGLAYKSYQYLNQFRANPFLLGKVIGLNLKSVKSSQALIWDLTLVQVAEEKAADMAARNYFSHIDPEGFGMNYRVERAGFPLPENWERSKELNSIESLAANNQGPEHFIDQLIEDKGIEEMGHRSHLLATIPFFQKATHIGIGIAYNPNSEYHYYCCILISPKGESLVRLER